jgi:hypothetical protein
MARGIGRALVSATVIAAAIATAGASCTTGNPSAAPGGGHQPTSQGRSGGGGSNGGNSGNGGGSGVTRHTGTPSHTKPTPHPKATTPAWTPGGPARVTTCGTAPNGYACAIHGYGFKPGEIVDETLENTGQNSSNAQADGNGDVAFSNAVSSAPGVTKTVTLRGRESGLSASGSWRLTCSDAGGYDPGCTPQ